MDDQKQLSKSALKKQKKLLKIQMKKAENASENKINENDMDPKAYREYRIKLVNDLMKDGINPWPHKFEVDIEFNTFIDKYKHLEKGITLKEVVHRIAGRIFLSRRNGRKLSFYTIESNGHNLQILANISFYENEESYTKIVSILKRGDIVGIVGHPGKSKKGELSIVPTKMILLAPNFHALPKDVFGLKDVETRFSRRYFDFMINRENRKIFYTRAKIISSIRRYLDNKQFLEVETPIISKKAGGASAKPFITYHNDVGKDMYMRVAPELYLKELVIGGFNRVYEIGKQFRNESIDTTHNPEFTSMEFYMAYADYNDLMIMCEELYSSIVMQIAGRYKIQINYSEDEDKKEIDFTPPFKKIDMLQELESILEIKFPNDLTTNEARIIIDKICLEKDIECQEPRTTARLIDKMVGQLIEPNCINPTFIVNHPQIMSPLAKWHRSKPNVVERFELFMNGFEFANAYTELNDPFKQKEAFDFQMKDKDMGDEEAQPIDMDYVTALEHGLPPTGGFGMGIDRFVMLLTRQDTIKEVLLFPTTA